MSNHKDYLHLHFIVMIWGFTAILGLLIELPTVEVVFYRTLIASIGLFFVVWLRKARFRVKHEDYLIILGTGVIIAMHWVTFFLSARISNASVCLAGMATCSLWTAVIEPISMGRKIKGYEVILGIVALIGMLIIFNVAFDFLSGLLLAVLSALLSAIFSVINGKLSQKYDPYVITFYEMIGACGAIIIFFPFYSFYINGGLRLSGSVTDFIYLIALALFCTVYAYSISVELMKRLSVFAINLTVNLEPVYGILLALIVFGEREEMSSGFYLGTGIILISVLAYPILNKRFKQKALTTDIIR